jgi:hypothetical protein
VFLIPPAPPFHALYATKSSGVQYPSGAGGEARDGQTSRHTILGTANVRSSPILLRSECDEAKEVKLAVIRYRSRDVSKNAVTPLSTQPEKGVYENDDT